MGMDEAQMDALLKPKTHGYGLYNVSERLKLFFDENSELKLENQKPMGSIVRFTIPKYVSSK